MAGGTPGHKFRKSKEPQKPEITSEQLATERRQRTLLDKEIGEEEDRLKLLTSGRLGRQSLLSGGARNVTEAASRKRSGPGSGGAASLLPGNTPRAGIPPTGSTVRRIGTRN